MAKTGLLDRYSALDEDVLADFKSLWKLSPDSRSNLIQYIKPLTEATTVSEVDLIIKKATKEIEGHTRDVLAAVRIVNHICINWHPIKDKIEDFLEELADFNLLPDEKIEEANAFLIDFLRELENTNKYRYKQYYTNALLPSYQGISTMIDFRAIMNNFIQNTLEEMDVDKYKPRCIGFAPVVLIEIRLDTGLPRKFNFQCDEETLEILIQSLQGAHKDLIAAKAALPDGE